MKFKDHPIAVMDHPTMTHKWMMTDFSQGMPPAGTEVLTRRFRDGDRFTLSADMVADILESTKESDREWVAGKFRLGRWIVLKAQRQNREFGFLCMGFEDEGVEPRWNMTVLEQAGFVWDEPEFEVLGILDCPVEYLTEEELVIRGVAEASSCSPSHEHLQVAWAYLEHIRKGMSKYGIVFYRP